MQRGYLWTAGSRDEAVPPLTGIAGRLERALRNFVKTFPLFAAAVLIAHVTNTRTKSDGQDDGWCMAPEIDYPESVHALHDLIV